MKTRNVLGEGPQSTQFKKNLQTSEKAKNGKQTLNCLGGHKEAVPKRKVLVGGREINCQKKKNTKQQFGKNIGAEKGDHSMRSGGEGGTKPS